MLAEHKRMSQRINPLEPVADKNVLWVPFCGELSGCAHSLAHAYPWGVWFWKQVWRREKFTTAVLWEYTFTKENITYLRANAPPQFSEIWTSDTGVSSGIPPRVLPLQALWSRCVSEEKSLSTNVQWCLIYCAGAQTRRMIVQGDSIQHDGPWAAVPSDTEQAFMRVYVDKSAAHLPAAVQKGAVRVDLSNLVRRRTNSEIRSYNAWTLEKAHGFFRYLQTCHALIMFRNLCFCLGVVACFGVVSNLATVFQGPFAAVPVHISNTSPKTCGNFEKRLKDFRNNQTRKKFVHVF